MQPSALYRFELRPAGKPLLPGGFFAAKTVFHNETEPLWKTHSPSTLSASVMGRRALQGLP